MEVAERLLGLCIEVAHADELAVLVDRCLPGDDHEVADPEPLGEPERLVGVGVELDLAELGHRDRAYSVTMLTIPRTT